MESIEVFYSEKVEAVNHQPNLDAITFEFGAHVQQSECSPTTSLTKNCLYQVRPFHPVIDAVAYVEVQNKPWLLLIQVSLSTYKSHKSKLINLFDDVKGAEAKVFKADHLSWLDYYIRLVPATAQTDLQYMYIYISPKDLIEKDGVSPLNECTSLQERTDSKKIVFFGMVAKDTASSRFVTIKELEGTTQ